MIGPRVLPSGVGIPPLGSTGRRLSTKNIGLPSRCMSPKVPLISECRLADLSSSHSILPLTKVSMPHSAAMPYTFANRYACWTLASVFPGVCIPPVTVGIRHAPHQPGDVPPVGAMSAGHPRHLQGFLPFLARIRLSSICTTVLPCASELKGWLET